MNWMAYLLCYFDILRMAIVILVFVSLDDLGIFASFSKFLFPFDNVDIQYFPSLQKSRENVINTECVTDLD